MWLYVVTHIGVIYSLVLIALIRIVCHYGIIKCGMVGIIKCGNGVTQCLMYVVTAVDLFMVG